MGDRVSALLAGLVVVLGVVVAGAGLSVFVEAWRAGQAWAGSPEAQLAPPASDTGPIWIEAGASAAPGAAPGTEAWEAAPHHSEAGPHRPDTGPHPPTPSPARGRGGAGGGLVVPGEAGAGASGGGPLAATAGDPPAPALLPTVVTPPAAEERARAEDVELAEVDFRFFDPPEPGAHARLALTVQNRADLRTGPLVVTVPAGWFGGFEVLGAIPAVQDDRLADDGRRQLVWDGLGPGERRTFELHVLATAEEVDGPEVQVALVSGGEIGREQPRTVAPRPRPGPVRAVTVPKLGIRASVVQVPWEPPPFVVGQIQDSAAVSLGNSVLLGHLGGPWGDVFARLDRLRPGDEVVATSRGLEYRFVVSDVAVRPFDDVSPTLPTETPRLTLMTCTGQWSVLRQDYTHRLWVVAEPPELAAQTIAANAERAAQAAREAEEAAAARAAHEALADASPVAGAATPEPERPGASPEDRSPVSAPGPVGPAQSPGPEDARPPVTPQPSHPQAGEGEVALVGGITVEAPRDGDAVPRRLTVRGARDPEADSSVDPGAPLWLVVRADVEGGRWYALPRPLDVRADGRWTADLELGGKPGTRHEIRVGVADPEADALLRRHAAERPGQPLDDLPDGFRAGTRVVVRRE